MGMKKPISRRQMEGIDRAAAADKSDPFARARMITHAQVGLTGYSQEGEEQFYDAEEATETRMLPPTQHSPEGREYKVTTYKNIRRP